MHLLNHAGVESAWSRYTILELYIQNQLHYFQGEFNLSKDTKEKLGGAVNDKFNDEVKW